MGNENKNTFRLLPFILQIALTMIVSMAIGGVLGYFVGKWFGFKPAVLCGLLLGAAGGMSSVLSQISKFIVKPKQEKSKELTERDKLLLKAEETFRAWKDEKSLEEDQDEDE